MTLTFNKNSWHRKLYSFTYGKDAPKDFCSYSRRIGLAVILLPLTWFGVFNKSSYLGEKIFGTITFYACVFILSGMGITSLMESRFSQVNWLYYFSPVIGGLFLIAYILVIILVLFLIAGIGWVISKFKNIKKIFESKIVSTFIKTKKEKYCPLIEWEE